MIIFYRVWGGGFKKNLYPKPAKNEPLVRETEEGKALLWKKRESEKLMGLINYLFNECEKEKCTYLFTPPVGDKFEWHLELFKGSRAQNWSSFEIEQEYQIQKSAYIDNPFTTNFPMRDRQFRFFPEEKMVQELIFSLQFIERTTTIFGLNGHWHIRFGSKFQSQKRRFDKLLGYVNKAINECNIKAIETKTSESVSGLSLEYLLVDSLGRKWPGSLIELLDHPEVTKEGAVEGLKFSVFQSFERWMSFFEN